MNTVAKKIRLFFIKIKFQVVHLITNAQVFCVEMITVQLGCFICFGQHFQVCLVDATFILPSISYFVNNPIKNQAKFVWPINLK